MERSSTAVVEASSNIPNVSQLLRQSQADVLSSEYNSSSDISVPSETQFYNIPNISGLISDENNTDNNVIPNTELHTNNIPDFSSLVKTEASVNIPDISGILRNSEDNRSETTDTSSNNHIPDINGIPNLSGLLNDSNRVSSTDEPPSVAEGK